MGEVTGADQQSPSPLAVALGSPLAARRPASIVGLEQEYVLRIAGARFDFRTLVHDLPIAGSRLDPGDLHAYRCRSGMVITCDAEDAEVVSPPVAVRPGFAAEVQGWAAHGRAELARLLPAAIAVTPYSTHLSVSMPDDVAIVASALFARTFAPALMLVLDRANSHGVFVRPRPGRLEVCGEHALGARLGAAAVLVAGGARACAAALGWGGEGGGPLPAVLAVDVRPATGREGLFVGRHLAFGFDLYAAGRRAALPLQAGGVISGQAHLSQAWAAACAALGADASDADLWRGAAMVSGSEPLGTERSADDDDGGGPDGRPLSAPTSPYGDVIEPRRRPGYEARAVAATWDFTVFHLTGVARDAYACVTGQQLGAFLERLDAGTLDSLLAGFLDAPLTGRVLATHDQTAEPGLWDQAIIGPDLLPYEGDAVASGVGEDGPVPVSYVRRGKRAPLPPRPDPPAEQPASAPPLVAATADREPPTDQPPPAAPPPDRQPPSDPPPPGGLTPDREPPTDQPPPVARRPKREPPTDQPPPVAPTPDREPPTDEPPPVARRPKRKPTSADIPSSRGERPRRPRRVAILVGMGLVILLSGAVAVFSGVLPVGDRGGVDVRTSPSTSPRVPGTARTTVPPVSEQTTSVAFPSATATTVAVDRTLPTPTTVPASATTPVPTTAPEPTPTVTTSPDTTTTTEPVVTPPTYFVSVTQGARSCGFQPSAATVVAGSTVEFGNDTDDSVVISIVSPVGADTTITFDAGLTSAPYPFTVPGTYDLTCTRRGDIASGQMTIVATRV